MHIIEVVKSFVTARCLIIAVRMRKENLEVNQNPSIISTHVAIQYDLLSLLFVSWLIVVLILPTL